MYFDFLNRRGDGIAPPFFIFDTKTGQALPAPTLGYH